MVKLKRGQHTSVVVLFLWLSADACFQPAFFGLSHALTDACVLLNVPAASTLHWNLKQHKNLLYRAVQHFFSDKNNSY